MEDLKSTSPAGSTDIRHRKGTLWQHQFCGSICPRPEGIPRKDGLHAYNPVRRGLVAKPEEWRWSSYRNFSMDPTVVESCPIRIDYVHMPDEYREYFRCRWQPRSALLLAVGSSNRAGFRYRLIPQSESKSHYAERRRQWAPKGVQRGYHLPDEYRA